MKRLVAALSLLAPLLTAGGAWAQVQNVVLQNSFSPVGAGARGLGMGGAFIAVADDGTAASFNPAGLSQLRKTEFAAVGFWDQLTSTVAVPNGGSSQTKNSHGNPEFFGISVPFDVGGRNLTVNFSYQRTVDLFGKGNATVVDSFPLADFVPGEAGAFTFVNNVAPTQSGAFNTASLAAGFQLTPRLSIGATASYWFANWKAVGSQREHLVIKFADLPQPIDEPVQTGTFYQQQTMHGIGFSGGFLLRYPKVSVGGVVRFPFVGNYNLVESDNRIDLGPRRRLVVDHFGTVATTELHWPLTLGAGFAIRPIHNLTLAGDFSSTHWSRTYLADIPAGALLTPLQTATNGVDSFDNRNFFDLVPQAHTSTVNTNQWRGGGEYLIVTRNVIVPLRAGYFLDRSPITDLGRDDGRRIKGWTAGLGINFAHVVLDFAVERRTSAGLVGLRLEANQPLRANLPTESVSEYRGVASLIYRFGDNDPVKRAFHWLLVGGEKENE